jgi:hypothetical protein
MNNRINLITVTLILLFILGCVNAPKQSKPRPNPTPELPHVNISARELSANYLYNWKFADENFKGKILTVTDGRTNSVYGSTFDIQGSTEAAVIRVSLKNSKIGEEWLGKRVTVRGRCTGGSELNVTIKDAEIIQ